MKQLAKRTDPKGLAKSQPSGAPPALRIEGTREQLEQDAIDSLQKLTGTQSPFSADKILTQVMNALVWPKVSQEDAILRPAAAIAEMGRHCVSARDAHPNSQKSPRSETTQMRSAATSTTT